MCVDGLLFLKDDVLDADPGRSRGFEGKAYLLHGNRAACLQLVEAYVVGMDPGMPRRARLS